MKLDDRQVESYSRQILLPEVGGAGQVRLLSARLIVAGTGPGAATAATYLAGAGIGELALVGVPSGGDPVASSAGHAPLAERSPDTRILSLPALPDDASAWDVLVLFPGAPATSGPAAGAGQPRRGAIRVADEGRSVLLVAAPTRAGSNGCAWCLEPAAAAIDGTEESSPGPPDVAGRFAGAMAALAACHWILELDGDPTPLGRRLDPEAATWTDIPLVRREPCERCGRPDVAPAATRPPRAPA